jgi:hypothetical protein
MTEIYADIAKDEEGIASGRLINHPCDAMTLRVLLNDNPGIRILRLMYFGRPIGEGVMHRDERGWRGSVSEYAGEWRVWADLGSTRLHLGEMEKGEGNDAPRGD